MGTHECTQERFLKDVAEHRMQILRDDGLYRHVRFSKPDSYDMGFDLITWPGHLCYTGDMGTYVFTRLPDMFVFFRTKPSAASGLYINTGYWSEKCVAADRRDGIQEYSDDKFRSAVANYVNEWREQYGWENLPDDLREEVDLVLSAADDGEYAAREAVRSFSYSDDEHGEFEFSDFFECSLSEYTFRFVWCCYALAWGVQAYDAGAVPSPTPPVPHNVAEAVAQ